MNAFIFVGIICVGQACTFVTSNDYMTDKECAIYKKDFLLTPYPKEVTMAAAQCMNFKSGAKV